MQIVKSNADGLPNEDRDLLEKIYEDYHRQMEYIAFGILQNRQDAEDAVQDAFLSLSAHLDTLKNLESFRVYYYVTETVRHKAIDLLRRRKSEIPLEDVSDYFSEIGTDFTEQLAAKDAVDEMLGLIRRMPVRYRDVLALCYVDGLNSKQISELLGRSDTTVRKQLQRGRAILLKQWKEKHHDES